MTTPTPVERISSEKQPTCWEDRFDDIWKNLYTFMPGLGQGDAKPAVKRFIDQELTTQREEIAREVEGLKRYDIESWPGEDSWITKQDDGNYIELADVLTILTKGTYDR